MTFIVCRSMEVFVSSVTNKPSKVLVCFANYVNFVPCNLYDAQMDGQIG